MNCVSQAGQSISLFPGRRFILRFRWHPGHSTSTRGTLAERVKNELHEPHLSSAGRWSTPATRTFEHVGQESFSSFHFRRVAGWSIRTRATQRVQLSSPKPMGSIPPHFGQESGGGATLDSTLNSSVMESLLLGVEDQLLGDEIPRHVKG